MTRQPKSLSERAPVLVADHGAVGDGVTDDTLALQSAINAARENNSTLRLHDGQYRITSFLDWGDWTGISVRDWRCSLCSDCCCALFEKQLAFRTECMLGHCEIYHGIAGEKKNVVWACFKRVHASGFANA